ncbi:MAG: putative small protein [Sphingomonadales bacterium]|jgi:uncharacterized protein YodC (DUF2158 family)|nr:putative small protein [Sphingomonadales bacterium]
MSTSFSLGDVVSLRSGGPSMTVVGVEQSANEAIIQTNWFDGTQFLSGSFPPGALEKDDSLGPDGGLSFANIEPLPDP